MTNPAHLVWPASARRLGLALAASACAHAAVLANAPFAPQGLSLSLLASSSPPISARLAAQPAAASPEPVAQRAEPAPAAPAGLPAPEIFYRGKDVDERAEPTNIADVEYPERALADGLPGKVTLRLKIDHNGELREAKVTEAEPPGVFEDAALKAVRALKFKPAVRNGLAVGSIKVIEVPFEPNCNRTGSCSN